MEMKKPGMPPLDGKPPFDPGEPGFGPGGPPPEWKPPMADI